MAYSKEVLAALQEKAKTIRRHIISMVTEAASGHPGGSLSAAEIITALYFAEMKIKPEDPAWPERDRFVLSKGHAAPVLYAALAERGYFPVEELKTLRKIDSRLQGHPARGKIPGIEFSTGSLGQGFSGAVGMALGGKLDRKDFRVYALLGDGELQEGQIWEAAMAAAHYQLDNLTAILDHNHFQIDGRIEDVLSPEPAGEKWRAFGWQTIVVDGHNFEELGQAFAQAKTTKGKPTIIIAETVKGKGVSFMEGQAGWHGKAPSREEAERALAELA